MSAQQRRAYQQLQEARKFLVFCQDAFTGFPTDDNARACVQAHVGLEDAVALCGEWAVPNTPSLEEIAG